MNTIYILSGSPRTAKTTIMKRLIESTHVQFIAGDAVEHGWRNLLTGDPHQMLKDIKIQGSAEFKASFTEAGERKDFKRHGSESELSFEVILGMIDYYRRNKESAAFEGGFKPEWISKLAVDDFEVRAAFVGYTNSSHADKILEHAKANPHDWINVWLQKRDGNDAKIREWATHQVEQCKKLKTDAF